MPSPQPSLMEIHFACQAFLGPFLPLSYHYAGMPHHLNFGAPGKLGHVQCTLPLQRPVQGLAGSRSSTDMPLIKERLCFGAGTVLPQGGSLLADSEMGPISDSKQPDQEGNWAGQRTAPGLAAVLPLPRFSFQDFPPWRLVEGVEGRRKLERRERWLSLFHEGRGLRSLIDPRGSNKEQKGEASCLAAHRPTYTCHVDCGAHSCLFSCPN